MNSNLPAGAESAPDRPWETADVLCPNCDTEPIGEMVDQYLAANPDCGDWDDAYQELDDMGSFANCRYCYFEQMADEDDD
jgi:hypothetical protein